MSYLPTGRAARSFERLRRSGSWQQVTIGYTFAHLTRPATSCNRACAIIHLQDQSYFNSNKHKHFFTLIYICREERCSSITATNYEQYFKIVHFNPNRSMQCRASSVHASRETVHRLDLGLDRLVSYVSWLHVTKLTRETSATVPGSAHKPCPLTLLASTWGHRKQQST